MTQKFSITVSKAAIFQREQLVLSNVKFDIEKGEMVYLIGKVGSGKSSLIKTLNAEIPLIDGSAFVAGFQIESIKNKEISLLRRKIGVVFQDFKLLSDRNVKENLLFVLKATGWTNKDEINKRITLMLDEVGMLGVENKMPHQLSGGEQQRIVIARALLNNPEIILADEPTGNLDHETSIEIMNLFKKINSEGKTILMATHDRLVIEKFPARTLICENGTLSEYQSDNNILNFRDIVR